MNLQRHEWKPVHGTTASQNLESDFTEAFAGASWRNMPCQAQEINKHKKLLIGALLFLLSANVLMKKRRGRNNSNLGKSGRTAIARSRNKQPRTILVGALLFLLSANLLSKKRRGRNHPTLGKSHREAPGPPRPQRSEPNQLRAPCPYLEGLSFTIKTSTPQSVDVASTRKLFHASPE